MIYFYRLAINYLKYLQLFDSFDNNSTIVQRKQECRPILCIYIIYVTIRIKHRFLEFFLQFNIILCLTVMSNQIK